MIIHEEQDLWYIQKNAVTDLFCPNKMQDSLGRQLKKTIKKGEYIYMLDQNADKIYFIDEGKIKIGSNNDTGKEITKALLGKGEVFGEMAMVGIDKRTDFALAMEDSTVCAVLVAEMKILMKSDNDLSLFFMKLMGSKVMEMEHRLESLVFMDSRSRIVEYLVELTEKKGERVGYEWVVRNFTTHQEIANYTATSRQTVTTILNQLRDNEQITFNRKRLLVRDFDSLKNEVKKV